MSTRALYAMGPCAAHELSCCADCWHLVAKVASDRTSAKDRRRPQPQGKYTPLIDQEIRGWDTTLIRGR